MKEVKRRIVVDSSADPAAWAGEDIGRATLKIITADKEYIDDAELDVMAMVSDLADYKGKSSTACPGMDDWESQFEDADEVFCVAITSGLSGSCNAARNACLNYEAHHLGRKAMVVDSLSAGPELRLIVEKLRELIAVGKTFDEIKTEIVEYQKHTGLLFMLESMRNLANNGRVSPLVAKLAGVLGIRVVGKASDQGTLEPLEKPRGAQKALAALMTRLKELGYGGGKIHIAHCFNSTAAKELKNRILAVFPDAPIEIYRLGGLCSFYAEKGGLLVGFEKKI
ncbi:MAG: DegV family protein [Clostridia bacterium]|nr:DegV family protein [Clostridia bacterium]